MKTARISPLRKTLFIGIYLGLLLVLVLMLELFFGVLGLGINTDPFVSIPGKPGYLRDNPDEYVNKYLTLTQPTGMDLFSNLFSKEKEKGTLRGIVIGESTPQGVPYAVNQSFPKIAELLLQESSQKVEILNIAASAMTSFYLKDVVRKIIHYSPDFVIIYAGHNEYYGAVSASTGNSPFFQTLYVNLKESRIFQVLFNLQVDQKKIENKSLMARQYAGKLFPPNQQKDAMVVETFLNNLKEAVNFLLRNKVKVFLFEPVSNIVSFPPFRGAGEDLLRSAVIQYAEVLSARSLNSTEKLGLDNLIKTYPDSAHFHYLKGLSVLDNENEAYAELLKAKDLDLIPFRGRSNLIAAITNWAKEKSKENPDLVWIETSSILKKTEGLSAFSWRNFIDQLHFNARGHLIMGNILATTIAKSYGLGEITKIIPKAPYLTPWDEFMAPQRMTLLLEEEPYAGMLLKPEYKINNHVNSRNPFLIQKDLQEIITHTTEKTYNEPLNFLREQFKLTNDYESWEYYLNSDVLKYPGTSKVYQDRGDFYAAFPGKIEIALSDWKASVQLSINPNLTEKSIKSQMTKAGLEMYWNLFKTKISSP